MRRLILSQLTDDLVLAQINALFGVTLTTADVPAQELADLGRCLLAIDIARHESTEITAALTALMDRDLATGSHLGTMHEQKEGMEVARTGLMYRAAQLHAAHMRAGRIIEDLFRAQSKAHLDDERSGFSVPLQ